MLGIVDIYSNQNNGLVASGELSPGIHSKKIIISGNTVTVSQFVFANPTNNIPLTVTALVKN